MSTYTQILYHIVFSTKNRKSVLTVDNRKRLKQIQPNGLKKKKFFQNLLIGRMAMVLLRVQ